MHLTKRFSSTPAGCSDGNTKPGSELPGGQESPVATDLDRQESPVVTDLDEYVALEDDDDETVLLVVKRDKENPTFVNPKPPRSSATAQKLADNDVCVVDGGPSFDLNTCPLTLCHGCTMEDILAGDGENHEVPDAACLHCSHAFCARCGRQLHQARTCEENQSLEDETIRDHLKLKEQARAEKLKRCPTCGFYVETIGGCNSIRCRCGVSFCNVCGSSSCKCQAAANLENQLIDIDPACRLLPTNASAQPNSTEKSDTHSYDATLKDKLQLLQLMLQNQHLSCFDVPHQDCPGLQPALSSSGKLGSGNSSKPTNFCDQLFSSSAYATYQRSMSPDSQPFIPSWLNQVQSSGIHQAPVDSEPILPPPPSYFAAKDAFTRPCVSDTFLRGAVNPTENFYVDQYYPGFSSITQRPVQNYSDVFGEYYYGNHPPLFGFYPDAAVGADKSMQAFEETQHHIPNCHGSTLQRPAQNSSDVNTSSQPSSAAMSTVIKPLQNETAAKSVNAIPLPSADFLNIRQHDETYIEQLKQNLEQLQLHQEKLVQLQEKNYIRPLQAQKTCVGNWHVNPGHDILGKSASTADSHKHKFPGYHQGFEYPHWVGRPSFLDEYHVHGAGFASPVSGWPDLNLSLRTGTSPMIPTLTGSYASNFAASPPTMQSLPLQRLREAQDSYLESWQAPRDPTSHLHHQ